MYNESIINNELEKLRSLYNKLISLHGEDINEKTMQNIIVTKLLDTLGYNKDYFYHEYITDNDGKVDLSVKNIETKLPILYIETKKPNHIFTQKDYSQIANYLNCSNINWGILTNGKTFILLNNSIDAKAHNKIVLSFNLLYDKYNNEYSSPLRNNNNLKLFSYEYLIENRKTDYFIYLSNYRNTIKNEHSYRQYESTVYNFLNYLADYYAYNLSYINPDIFKEYIVRNLNSPLATNRKVIHKETIKNNFSHINSFYRKVIEPLEKRNPFKEVNQTIFLNSILKSHDLKEKDAKYALLLTNEEIKMLLVQCENNRHNLRNTLIVLLFVYAGIDTHEISELKIKDFHEESCALCINNRIIPLPKKLSNLVKLYKDEQKKLKPMPQYLFSCRYYNSYRKISNSNMNAIINDQFKLLNISEERKKILNTSFIKKSLIKSMIYNKIPLQEISKFTGLSLSTLEDYITNEDISNVKFDKILKNHPYKEIFESLDD